MNNLPHIEVSKFDNKLTNDKYAVIIDKKVINNKDNYEIFYDANLEGFKLSDGSILYVLKG